MNQYHKIQSVFKRDHKTKRFTSEYTIPEFEYLKDNTWIFEEKVDGTNIRIMWNGEHVKIGGKTDMAQIPAPLANKLVELFPKEKFEVFTKEDELLSVCLYGEGYGKKIQKGGGDYIPDGCSFILFDVRVGRWWLNRESVKEIADQMGIKMVPRVGWGPLSHAIKMCQEGFPSVLRDPPPEGLVIRPQHELFARNGQRIITKLKLRDFEHDHRISDNSH